MKLDKKPEQQDLLARIDPNVRELVRTINELPGLFSFSSCGGHCEPENHQLRAGSWEVSFKLAPARRHAPSLEAWLSFEQLVFLFSKVFPPEYGDVRITTFSPDPFLNGYGTSISFALESSTADPEYVATWIRRAFSTE